jgi:hypothetical protein
MYRTAAANRPLQCSSIGETCYLTPRPRCLHTDVAVTARQRIRSTRTFTSKRQQPPIYTHLSPLCADDYSSARKVKKEEGRSNQSVASGRRDPAWARMIKTPKEEERGMENDRRAYTCQTSSVEHVWASMT